MRVLVFCIVFAWTLGGASETRVYDQRGLLRAVKRVPPTQARILIEVFSEGCTGLQLEEPLFETSINPSSREGKSFSFEDLPSLSEFYIRSDKSEGCRAEVVKIE